MTNMRYATLLLVRPQHAEDELKTQSLFSTYINVFSAYDLLQV